VLSLKRKGEQAIKDEIRRSPSAKVAQDFDDGITLIVDCLKT
jgi:hypothetical protein